MKKNFFYAAALAMGLSFSMTACSNEDTPTEPMRPTLTIRRKTRRAGTTT